MSRLEMAENPERRRILDLLAGGQINAEEAGRLLSALEHGGASASEDRAHAKSLSLAAGRRADAEGDRRIARSLRIVIDAGGEDQRNRGRVAVTVPLALAKFAGKLIPEDVRSRLEDEGIELAELLQALDQELPEGRLVDIDTMPEGDNARRARIIVEVV
jgi:DNA-binding transcriptional ArsR family regulator